MNRARQLINPTYEKLIQDTVCETYNDKWQTLKDRINGTQFHNKAYSAYQIGIAGQRKLSSGGSLRSMFLNVNQILVTKLRCWSASEEAIESSTLPRGLLDHECHGVALPTNLLVLGKITIPVLWLACSRYN